LLASVNLSTEDADATHILDLFFSLLGEESGLYYERLLRQRALTKHFEDAMPDAVDDRNFSLLGSSLLSVLLSQQRPQLFNVDHWPYVAVFDKVEVAHPNLAEVTRMVLVKHDPVVVLPTCVSVTARMLTVLSDTSVPCGHVTALLPVGMETSRHGEEVLGFTLLLP